MALTVYGAALSPFVRKVRVALMEKGLNYEHVHVDPFKKPEDYHEISPFGRIPAFKDGDKILADSAVICSYLQSKYPEPALYPADPYERARTLWFEKFGDYELSPIATFDIFRNRVVMKLIGQSCNEDKVADALNQKLPPLLDYLEKEIGRNEFIAGNQLTVADIAIASQVANMELGGERIDNSLWPNTAAYVERMLARPHFAALIEQELGFVKKFLG